MSAVIVTTREELAAIVRAEVRAVLEERDREASPPVSDWITAEEAAAMIGYCVEYVRRRKDIPSHSIGPAGKGRRRYRRSEIDAWLAQRSRAA